MIVVLVCSAILVICPILVVQYQRFLKSAPDAITVPISNQYQSQASNTYSPQQTTALAPSQPKENAGYDGTASDSASERLSEPRPGHVATGTGFDRRKIIERPESRKPWDPPFPMRAKTVREPYRVLPSIGSTSDQEYDRMDQGKGKKRERRSTSQVPPEEEGEDGLANMGHVPVTDPSSYRAPAPPPAMHTATPAQESQNIMSQVAEEQGQPAQAAPQPTPATAKRERSLSIVQTVVLILAFIIFVFAFAVLVAHCMAWFVVYKTEARLGEMRKGLLRGGDMRVCLCAR